MWYTSGQKLRFLQGSAGFNTLASKSPHLGANEQLDNF